jgi:methylase of polypeptide subunit release factors
MQALRNQIEAGDDPLGTLFCRLRSPEMRRTMGATYTPRTIITPMVEWARAERGFSRVIDPGAGSGRFLLAAGRRFPRAQLIAVEVDPLAALLARANLAVAGLSRRARVVVSDYRTLRPDPIPGATLYIGNPPYVRHHQISTGWKAWLTLTARAHGLEASQLAGLHVHFFLATAHHADRGDVGVFITSAEWLDVNYGSLVRQLLLERLGGLAIHVLEPTTKAFEDAITTTAITCFEVGARPSKLRLQRVSQITELDTLKGGHKVGRERLAEAPRWTPLTRTAQTLPAGYIQLGELCRVHRGQVTGSNAIWLTKPGAVDLPPQVLFPSVTRARELFEAGPVLCRLDHLRQVIDIPPELDGFDPDEQRLIWAFLRKAERAGAANGYIARYRRAWWSVGLHAPAPILATYMARRPPAFVRNPIEARHINIAHGLYPRQELPSEVLDRLAAALRTSISVSQGRTYAGGLTKFEPKEMERLPIPDLPLLMEPSHADPAAALG